MDGIAFNSLNTFPEGGATGAIVTNLQTAGFCGSTCNLSFAYVDLGKALPAKGSITITASGVGAGTALYAEVLNNKGQIIYITANSESGITGRGTSVVPEPGSLTLMGTGLLGLPPNYGASYAVSQVHSSFSQTPGGNVRGFVLLAPQPDNGHSGTIDGTVLPVDAMT